MNTLKFTPKEFNEAIDNILLHFADQVGTHMVCICKKKVHKHCPRHQGIAVMKMVYNQRQPLGDKLLHLQSKEASKENRMIDMFEAEPRNILPMEQCRVIIKEGKSLNTKE